MKKNLLKIAKFTFCFVFVLTLACNSATKTQQAAFNEVAMKDHIAVKPEPRTVKNRPNAWKQKHQAILNIVKQGNIDLIFVGDSITEFWGRPAGADRDWGKQIWNHYYAPRHAANLGVSGDQTQHVLWRLDHGEVDGINPKVAVVMIGTNNFQSCTAEQISDGIIAVCAKLREKLPQTKILLLAIFPRDPQPDEKREKLAQASKLASRIADNKTIFYLDINQKFLQPDGTLSADIMPDYLHPHEKGYQIWAAAMEPTLAKLLGDKKVSPDVAQKQ